MKENTKIKMAIFGLIIISFIWGFSLESFISRYAQDQRIEAQLTQLIEINRQLLDHERSAVVVPTQEAIQYEGSCELEPIYDFSDEEIILLAQLLCGSPTISGDGEYDFESQIPSGQINWVEVNKVLEVVMNRTLTPGVYADNIKDVLLQPGAFSVFPKNLNTTPSKEVIASVKYWCDSFNSAEYIASVPSDHFWFSAGSRGTNVTRNHL